MNEVVKYHNDLSNQITIKTLNSNELNFFYAICSKMRDKNLEEITFTFEQLKELTKWTSNDNKDFIKSLENTNKKLIQLNFTFRDTNKIVQFVLFPTFTIDTNEKTLKVRVNKDFSFLLNTLTNNFTRFELENFTTLTSKYSKYLYKELMKFKSTGYCVFAIDEFRDKLDIPSSYRMTDINKNVLDVCIVEFSEIFENFKINKIKKGRKIETIEFYFKLKNNDKNTNTNEVIVENAVNEKKELTAQEQLKQFFKNNFKDIVYNSKIEKALEKRLKKDKLKTIENDLLQQYSELQKLDYIKNKTGLFCDCILNNKRIVNDKKLFIVKEEEDIYKNKTEDDFIQATLFEKMDILEILNNIDDYDKLKIEERAIKLYVAKNDVDINFLFKMKDTNQDMYYLTIKEELEKAYNEYLEDKKDKNDKNDNISSSNNKKNNDNKYSLAEIKAIMINNNKLDLNNITDTIKDKIITDVESNLKDVKDILLFRMCKEKELATLIDIFSNEFVESFNKFHSRDFKENAKVTIEVTKEEIEKKLNYILEHKDKFIEKYRDLLLSKNKKMLSGSALNNRLIKLIQENIIKI